MGVTTDLAIPFPNLADAANGPGAFQASLQYIDDFLTDTTIQPYVPVWTSSGGVAPTQPSSLLGSYRVDHGVCHFRLRLLCDATTTGGTGNLVLTGPLPANATFDDQNVMAEINSPAAGGGVYMGFGKFNAANGAAMQIFFPASSSDVRLQRWRNAAA
ncbi:MAG TPA: hypothetical protein VF062_00725, partial [Candidatus Limnocylindrales bacterium]